MHPFQLTSAGSCFAATALGRFTVFSDPCASGLTFAPQALRPACPAVDPSVHRILTEGAFGVCAALPRPEGRGLSRTSVTLVCLRRSLCGRVRTRPCALAARRFANPSPGNRARIPRVDKVAAGVMTSGSHFLPQLIRGAHGTARENRDKPQRTGVAVCAARSPCSTRRTPAPSWEQPVRGTRKRLTKNQAERAKPPTPAPPHPPLRGIFLWAESRPGRVACGAFSECA